MDKDLQNVFSTLRDEKPEISFETTSRRFLKAHGVGVIGIFLALFLRKWNYLHWIIMTTSIITITVLALIMNGATTGTSNGSTPHLREEVIAVDAMEPEETVEIEYFTADSQLVQRIRKEKGQTTIEKLTPLPVKKVLYNEPPAALHPSFTLKDTLSPEPIKRCFKVEKNMNDQDLIPIEEAAKAAGLDFHYKILVWKGKVKKLEYHIKWSDEDGKFCTYQVELKGKFTACIGWYEDANGKAVGLLD